MDLRALTASDADVTPLVRVDFSDDDAWSRLAEAVQAPVWFGGPEEDDEGYEGYEPGIALVDDRAFDGVTATDLAAARADLATPTYVLLADQQSMQEARADLSAATVVYVDLTVTEEDEQESGWVYGRAFRCVVGEVASIESNLAIANMDFDEFASYADNAGGVFRGF